MAWTQHGNVSTTSDFSGLGKSSVTKGADKFYELEPALVFEVSTRGDCGVSLYSLFSHQIVRAIPLNENIKVMPLVGELVLYSKYNLGNNPINDKYFYEAISWHGNTHTNEFPFLLEEILKKLSGEMELDTLDLDKNQNINKSILKNETGKYFKRDINSFLKKLVPFEGDIIFEGRLGQSIRFGSSIPKKFSFDGEGYELYRYLIDNSSVSQDGWMFSKNKYGGQTPLIIISSGKTNIDSISGYSLENIQKDPSTILLCEGGPNGLEFPFLLSAIEFKPKKVDLKNIYNDDLILLNSNRLVLNSRTTDIYLSSGLDIIGISMRDIYFKTKNTLELGATTINLGEDAKKSGQPIVLANDLMEFLSELVDSILTLKYNDLGMIIPGTDIAIKSLQRKLKNGLKNSESQPIFSSKHTFTL